MELLDVFHPPLRPLGKLRTLPAADIASSRLGVGCECLDRDMWNLDAAWPMLAALGAKWARVQTGWARCERQRGEYDFAWLDAIVDGMLARGIQPWLSISYGNPLYTPRIEGPDSLREFLLTLHADADGEAPDPFECDAHGVGFPPLQSEDARRGWQNYTRALVRHFADRVLYYEVWNEPDGRQFWRTGPDPVAYAELVRLTAEVIRAELPDARIIGGAVATGLRVTGLAFLERCFLAGMHNWIDIVTYHGYKAVPERHSVQEFAALHRLLQRYKPDLEFWQGEAGIQSRVALGGRGKAALSDMRCTETVQARVLLRRTLLELHNGCGVNSYFHLADFSGYSSWFPMTFHYGVLRLEDASPKPSYHALQTLCTLLADPMQPAAGRTACQMALLDDSGTNKTDTWHASFVCGDVPVHAWWLPDSPEAEVREWRAATASLWLEDGLRLQDPVLIEPVSGAVFAVNATAGVDGLIEFSSLPVGVDPLLLTDRSHVEVLSSGG